ncbi:hypothetical protein CY658_12970 [Variovorax sp. RO1]|uniref:hypothetical protein n=1 Tax=Variovorax sp. RO1 TaxID=2066034 RepID=UPI000C716865|nr:hypothetical protein [Variovorax sp. RO1]PLC04733.1 hypothetical protein CY658_12970 [Variovorax sp. RO1]
MLKIIRQVDLIRATDPAYGNIQTFLEQLVVEVIAGNYRYFLNEHLINSVAGVNQPEALCWPPLLANERQVSGLFANALSSVCPVSRPEYAILRPGALGKRGKVGADRNGRVDFFATYGKRSLALELKQISISSLGDVAVRRGLAARWKSVQQQSAEALTHLCTDRVSYPHPTSVGLLVVRVSRKVSSKKLPETARAEAAEQMPSVLERVRQSIKPDFLAHYEPPLEMQTSGGWGDNGNEYKVFPGVIFAAVVHGKQPPKKR